jgi:glucan endo-1,3-beta-D-glucosidase
MWASGGDAGFANELAALNSAISLYANSGLGSAVVGISVGSEDLYRNSPTGIAGDDGVGANPDTITGYISQVRSAIAGTVLSSVPVGHVDTWTAWVNSSNDAVIAASDFIGMDAYPYFQNTEDNSISTSYDVFFEAYYNTTAVAGGKPVWVTETGWPVSGPTENLAVPSLANAQTYWDLVACALIGKVNTYWYTLQDAAPVTPSPSFGIVGSTLSTTPLYNLTCPAPGSTTSSSTSALASSTTTPASSATTSLASAVGASIIASSEAGVVSSAGSGPIVISAESSVAATGTVVPVTNTVYTTEEVTITTCAASVSSCPARVTTTTYAVTTSTYLSSSTAVAAASGPSVTNSAGSTTNSTLTTASPSAPLSTFTGGAAGKAASAGGVLGLVLAVFAAL